MFPRSIDAEVIYPTPQFKGGTDQRESKLAAAREAREAQRKAS